MNLKTQTLTLAVLLLTAGLVQMAAAEDDEGGGGRGDGGGAGGKLPVAYNPHQAKASGGTVLNLSGIRPAGEQPGLSSIAVKLAGIKKNPGSSVRSGVQYTSGGSIPGSGGASPSPAPVTRAS